MATAAARTRPERSKSLHNFMLPNLKWGSQRHLKCMKIDSMSNGDHRLRRRSPPSKFAGSSASIPFQFREADRQSINHRLKNAHFKYVEDGCDGGEEGIGEYRVKIMSDLKTESDKITQFLFKKDEEEQEDEKQTDGSRSGSRFGSGQEKEISPVKPWNLRKRKAAGKEPIFEIEEKIVNPSPAPSTLMMKGRGGVVAESTETNERQTKLFVKLSKKKIEEDFMAILGRRPSRRPKKRPRTVQRKLDSLSPGLYSSEVALDAYKVPDDAKNPQR